ncbi:pentapeptide repeat-containing protein (plasmid) [Rhodococcus qingshengii]|uniref:pentapeptide repeat-containing protein n=1 Tax=Rhodococcus qingshengii TaxID=334542 RepID=UPI002112D3B4|nr:pentapeptide repeat-containing protein [Rhodococcus qingshengii]UUE28495.1 pentapeptide repeat-containing protein [Rhodococcus qingshengii]
MGGEQLFQISRSSAFAVGALGAVVAIVLGYRRQKSTEDTHQHLVVTTETNLGLERAKQDAERVADMHDRYTKAVEQLAHKGSTIRLGGVHAIAALGDDWTSIGIYKQRQVCVDLLCSYLRSVPRINEEFDNGTGELVEWDADDKFLEQDRDVRKAALEWLSRVATADNADNARRDQTDRNPEDTVAIELRGISLRKMDMRFSRLAHLPMENADLHGTRLMGADLSGANLFHANLSYTRLEKADLRGTKLSGATLHSTHLEDAKMRKAQLPGAKLIGTTFDGADLTDANLKGARIDEHVTFLEATLVRTDFTGVRGSGVPVDVSGAKDITDVIGLRTPRRVGSAENEDSYNQPITGIDDTEPVPDPAS